MQRYFIDDFTEDQQVIISGEDHYHICKVMRMKPGDQIICVNSCEKAAICKIAVITDDQVVADIVQWKSENTELPISVTISMGLPKGDKLDWVIQKGTELGAHEFIPFAAARSVVKWDHKKAAKKVERWQKIAKEATEQSHRSFLPEVANPYEFHDLLKKSMEYDYKLVAFEDEGRNGEKSAFFSTLKKMKKAESLLVLFGPEGGFAPEEITLLKENGFELCGLGPRILRTETAPLYALAAISYHFELMG